jgi:glycosidase
MKRWRCIFAGMKKIPVLFLLFILFFSCNKENHNNPVIPPPDDTTTFTLPATEDIVMYEVNLRALSSTGDIPGVTARLDEIKALGVNVIWLMPIYPVGQVNSVNSPYCVKNYKEVNPEFGSLSDLKALVTAAHKQNIAVILDWVANHTAWDNPWIANKDWYTQDGSGNIVSPPGTNWADVADLDYDNAAMRLAMIDAMEYWVSEADIDGFRCDAADMVPVDFWSQAIDSVNGSTDKGLVWLAEGSGTGLFTAGFQMNYSWSFYSQLKSVIGSGNAATSLVSVNIMEYNGLPAGRQKLRFTTNHDESAWDATPMTLFGGEQGALAASVAAICLGGVPMVYGSQEVGTTGTVPFFSHQPINWNLHPEMLQAYKELLGFYNKSAALRKGEIVSFSTSDVLAFTKISGQDTVFVLDNMRNETVNFDLPASLEGSWKNAVGNEDVILSDKIDLEDFEYRILMK